MPTLPTEPSHWLFGHKDAWVEQGNIFPARACLAHGGIVGLRLLNQRWLVLGRTDLVRHAYVTRADIYQRGYQFDIIANVFGETIGTEGPVWKQRRGWVQPAFSAARLPHQSACALRATEAFAAKMPSSARDATALGATTASKWIVAYWTFLSVFGHEPSEADIVAFQSFMLRYAHYQFSQLAVWQVLLFNRAPKANGIARALRAEFHAFAEPHFERSLAAEGGDAPLALGPSIWAQSEQAGFSPEHRRRAVMDQTVAQLMLAYEAPFVALAWCLLFLAQRPDLQQRVQAEIDALPAPTRPTHGDAQALATLRAVVLETLRLYPPTGGMIRTLRADDEIGGYPVKAGTEVLISFLALHRQPEVWPDAERFDPDRFAPQDVRLKNGSFLPFGAGPHTCVGNTATVDGLIVMLACVLARYSVRFDRDGAGVPAPNYHWVLVEPSEDVPLRFEARAGAQGTPQDAGEPREVPEAARVPEGAAAA